MKQSYNHPEVSRLRKLQETVISLSTVVQDLIYPRYSNIVPIVASRVPIELWSWIKLFAYLCFILPGVILMQGVF